MNVSAFLGGKTTEHENFSAQGNDRRKTSKKRSWVSIFWSLKKMFWKSTKNFLVDGGLFGVVHSEFK